VAAFIHGEVNWAERPEVVGANVRRMLNAVAHYPWTSTSVEDISAHPVCSVMGVQRGLGTANPPGDLPGQEAAAHIVADLNLHARDDLAFQLGISRAEAPYFSDEALVLRAYRRWGVGCADRLVGEGTFALWDASEQRMICWRDAAGVRPLYYHHVPGRRFVFSSDLQSIAAHPVTPSTLDLQYTSAFLRSEQFQHPTRTLVEGVRKVRPAHILVFDRSGVHLQRYWDPGRVAERATADDSECVEELSALLRQSIDDRLSSSGAGVGAHLSGGLDSSSVALMTAALLQGRGHDLRAYSWAPPREVVPAIERDERDLVEAAAQFGAIRARYTHLRPNDVVEVAYRDVALRPRATLNFEVATSRQAVDAGVRTLFSGWGGDEVIAFNGRGYFSDLARQGRLVTVRRELKLRSQIQGGSLRGAWKARVVMPLLPDMAIRNGSGASPPLPAELRPEFAHVLATVEPLEHTFPRERPGVHRMQASLLQFGHLQYRMESWAAHGAALGLTYTFPLLDRRIMEFALSLPGRMFFRDGWKRWLYRTAMEGVLPEVVRWNPKKYDDAAGHQLRKVLLEPADVYREPLLERKDNPLVDVSVLLAEQERQQQLKSSSNGSASRSPASPVGGGTWLAFTQLQPA
jgi:asparagine synthase (glutamine-hydrolysing)